MLCYFRQPVEYLMECCEKGHPFYISFGAPRNSCDCTLVSPRRKFFLDFKVLFVFEG
jgi:hypothetical protein